MSDHDLPGRVRLIGGEMPTWSDLESAWEPARSGAQLPILLAALAGRSRVLIAGPHEPDLIAAVAGAIDGELTCLVRSIPDARLLGETFDADAGDGRVRIVCGSLERFDDTGYDAVVALDDIVRLYSTEGPEPVFGTALADLRRLLTPDGLLVVMVNNELGVHRLTAEVQPEADESEPAWTRPADSDNSRPRGLADLAEQFGPGAAIWPVYPLPSAPVVAWGAAVGSVDRTEHAGLLAALSEPATRSLERARPTADVASLMLRVRWSGRLPEFAAGWLVVAGPGADRSPAPDDVVAWLATDQGEPFAVRLADGSPVLPDGSAVPAGWLLPDVLAQAVVAPDQAALRSAIRGYADWLATLSDVAPAPAGRVVLDAAGEHRVLALGGVGSTSVAKTADEQLLIAVADLVRRVERHGYRRTWPSHLTPAEAVAWVAAMRGTPVPDDVLRQVVAETGLDRPLDPRSGEPIAVEAAAERFEESNASRARWFETRLKAAETQLTTAWVEVEKARRAYRELARVDNARLRNRLKTAAKEAAPPGAKRIGRAVRTRLGRVKRLTRRLRG
ncbi:hypothetical protein [Paractinoplanes globisporus]|uniref:Class I SAM-dependent methyltransferase n=1 Tax=Paractinoplanes globisporus TaxID=113565 RepID=A0ABW6WXG0_9ACTN|nr:hypothetical protein [Actinoplanes globisporus]